MTDQPKSFWNSATTFNACSRVIIELKMRVNTSPGVTLFLRLFFSGGFHFFIVTILVTTKQKNLITKINYWYPTKEAGYAHLLASDGRLISNFFSTSLTFYALRISTSCGQIMCKSAFAWKNRLYSLQLFFFNLDWLKCCCSGHFNQSCIFFLFVTAKSGCLIHTALGQ